MRSLLTFFFCFVFILSSLSAQQVIPNSSFETGSGDSAAGWSRFSGEVERIFLQEFKLPDNSVDTQYATQGKYFMRLTSTDTLINGQTLANIGSIASTFPYTDRPKYVVFKAMYLPKSVNDRFQVHLVFTRWNTATKKREVVLNYGVNSDSNKAYYPWTTFSAPITYNSAFSPDTLSISLNTSGRQVSYGVGTTLWIDQLLLTDSVPTGIVPLIPQNTMTGFSVYPNPATNRVHFHYNLQYRGEVQLVFYDLSGRMVWQYKAGNQRSGEHELTLDLPDLFPGMYLCRLFTDNESAYQKIIIRR